MLTKEKKKSHNASSIILARSGQANQARPHLKQEAGIFRFPLLVLYFYLNLIMPERPLHYQAAANASLASLTTFSPTKAAVGILIKSNSMTSLSLVMYSSIP